MTSPWSVVFLPDVSKSRHCNQTGSFAILRAALLLAGYWVNGSVVLPLPYCLDLLSSTSISPSTLYSLSLSLPDFRRPLKVPPTPAQCAPASFSADDCFPSRLHNGTRHAESSPGSGRGELGLG